MCDKFKKKKIKTCQKKYNFSFIDNMYVVYTCIYSYARACIEHTSYKYTTHARRSLSFSQAMDKLESVSWIEEPPTCHDQGIHTDTNNYVFNL